MSIFVPESFHDSCLFWSEYPLNIIDKALYGRRLHGYRRRLLIIAPTALAQDPANVRIPIIDISDALAITSCDIRNTKDLREWLGDTYEQNPINPAKWTGKLVSKKDPRARFVFLVNSRDSKRLDLRLEDLVCLGSYHQVMPDYMDFLSVYGVRGSGKVAAGLRFTGFRSRLVCSEPLPGHVIVDIGRSGRRLELCYNLKSAVRMVDMPLEPEVKIDQPQELGFSIQQAAVYHRFDLKLYRSFWMMTDPGSDLRDTISHLLRNELQPSEVFLSNDDSDLSNALRFNLDIHLALVEWATEEWKWYVDRLEDRVEAITAATKVQPGHSGRPPPIHRDSMYRIQPYEDLLNQVIMILESNLEVFSSLTSFYHDVAMNKDLEDEEHATLPSVISSFSASVQEYANDTRLRIAHVRDIVKGIADWKFIVSQTIQTNANDKAEILNNTILELTERSHNEAIAMRIVTVVTLLYLPPTFVSTFFSTDIIRYQGDGGVMLESFSALAIQRWLQVSLPLMLFTCLGAWLWYSWEFRRRVRKRNAAIISRD
ncbi:hypothetical protein QBC37DRAFT_460742 [Rhypophila decipiens]|uniref:CorA-like transporter domain-containing protein n=1 Tax=Rhypophila decipiens TaxID=261697 RepID=A0AAN7B8X0_9PEZI|nr:hypothetical protein QBC37DRAFT_460742 [Rhypophila decipiens]